MNNLVWTERTKRSIRRGYVAIPFVINVTLNATLPFVFFGHLDSIPVKGGSTSVHIEVIATAILLPAITAIICWVLIRRDIRLGHLEVPTSLGVADYHGLAANQPGVTLSKSLVKVGQVMSSHYLIAVVLATTLWGPIIYVLGRCMLLLVDQPFFSVSELAVFKAALAGFGGMGVAPSLCVAQLAGRAQS